jgi:hypothetical protein
LRCYHIANTHERERDRASKRRQIAKDVMVELDLKKLSEALSRV